MISRSFILSLLLCVALISTISISCGSKKRVTRGPSVETNYPNRSTSENTNRNLGDGEVMEKSPNEINLDMKESSLRLNYKLNKSSINDTFNTIIDTLLANQFEVEGMDIQIEKDSDAAIEFEGKKVLIQVPLKISAAKETFIKTIKGDGVIKFYLISHIDIDQNWNLTTKTNLETYEWIREPKMQIAGLSVPIERIMNIVIEKSKDGIIHQIDDAVKTQFRLREQIISMLYAMRKPIMLEESSNTVLKINPDGFFMTGTRNNSDWTEGIIKVDGKAHISHDAEFEDRTDTLLPPFRWLDKEIDSSDLFFNIDFKFSSLNNLLQNQFVGKTFSEGDKEITIKDIELKGLDDKIGVIANVEGTYNGQILLSAIPEYDKHKKVLTGTDADVKLLTKNVLHKALGWMLKGRIKKELDKLLVISLGEKVGDIQSMINEQIDLINEDESIGVTADIKDLDITRLKFSENNLHATIHVPMYLELKIHDLFGIEKYGTSKQTFSLPDEEE